MIANILGSDTLIVLVVAVVVLFGGSQLPKLAKNVGSAGREFRRAQAEAELGHSRTEATATVPPAAVLPAAVPADDMIVVSRSETRSENLACARMSPARSTPGAISVTVTPSGVSRSTQRSVT